MSNHRDIDELSGVDTTGHSWDGIKELNNPLPRWWLWTFYATVIWAIAYCIAYPAWPLISGATGGVLGWHSRADLHAELAAADAAKAAIRDQIAVKTVPEILANPDLRAFATSAGASLFKVNCVQCHGSGAQGGPGYPNLNDDSWIWGGKPEDIEFTISHGIRNTTSDQARTLDMPAYGKEGTLTPEQIGDVTEHVLSLAKLENDAARAAKGAPIYAEQCAGCHGDVGQGNATPGAPQLNDAIWLYGGTREQIASQLHQPRLGVMPAWLPKLGAVQVKELATYVHSLGGGQ